MINAELDNKLNEMFKLADEAFQETDLLTKNLKIQKIELAILNIKAEMTCEEMQRLGALQ